MTHTPEKIGIIMTQVKNGDTVSIHYTGTLNDGTTFDSSEGRDPLAFQVGSGQIIPGLDSAMPGMAVGDKKTVNVPCDQAYGPVNPDMRQEVPRGQIPADIPTEVGTRLQMQTQTQMRVQPHRQLCPHPRHLPTCASCAFSAPFSHACGASSPPL